MSLVINTTSRRTQIYLILVLATVATVATLGLAWGVAPASAADASVVITATVPSSTSLDATGCPSATAGITDFGTVLPGADAVTANDCVLSFGSTNDTSKLVVHQTDGVNAALGTADSAQIEDSWDGLTAVSADSTTDAWAVGTWGTTLHRTGTTWTNVSNPAPTQLNAVSAVSSSLAYAVGGNGTIIRWNGSAWSLVDPGFSVDDWLVGVYALDASHVWVAGGDGDIYFYDGSAWSDVTPTGMNADLTGITGGPSGEANCSPICIYVSGTETWKSTTGGTTTGSWAKMTSAFTQAISVSPYDGLRLWATDGGGDVMMSSDGGATWSQQLYDPWVGFDVAVARDATALATTVIYSVGRYGGIEKSADGGATWTNEASPTTNKLYAVDAVDGANPVIAGSGRLVAASTDAGATWSRESIPDYIGDLHGVSAVDGKTAYAVGGEGTVLKTTNGSTWSVPCSPCGTAESLRAVSAVDANTVFAVGNNATIIESTDGGTTWAMQPPPAGVTADLWGVSAVNADLAYAVGDDGTVIKWNGSNWTNLNDAGTTNTLVSVSASDATHVFISGIYDTLEYSDDGGASWTQTAPYPAPDFMHGIATVGPNHPSTAYAATWQGIYKTTDGTTWTKIRSISGTALSVSARGSVVWVGGYGGYLTSSDDGGATWRDHSGLWADVQAVSAVDANTVFTAGESQMIGAVQPLTAAAAMVADYNAATNNWSDATALFGVCLKSLTGTNAAADWSTTGTCAPADSSPWNGVPDLATDSGTKIAHTTAAGSSGSVAVRYGFKAADNQVPGHYAATLTYEVLAPDV